MEKRPKIKLQLSSFDKLLEAGAKFFIVLLWILSIVAFFKMPAVIPTHFNASGKADNYGDKSTIFILPVIATILFAGLTILNHFPHIFNYLNKITEDNAVQQYTRATRMLRFLKLLIAITFTVIQVITFLTSLNIVSGAGPMFLPLIIALFLIAAMSSIAAAVYMKREIKK